MNKVRKAVIPVAGLGTRFLPITKTIPKEMLPIVDKPNLLYNIEEIVKAGIEDIILVQGRGKYSIEDFFDVSYELEDQLLQKNKTELLERVSYLKDMCNIISIRQKKPLGLGHAVYCAEPAIGNQPFALLLGDELVYNSPEQPTATQSLIKHYEESSVSTVAIMKVDEKDVSKYGIIDGSPLPNGNYKINNVIEKPSLQEAPTHLALPGRYVFSGKIFDYLKNTKPGKNGEIQLTDGMVELAKQDGLHGAFLEGQRYDTGNKLGFLIANIEYALRHPELKTELRHYLSSQNWNHHE